MRMIDHCAASSLTPTARALLTEGVPPEQKDANPLEQVAKSVESLTVETKSRLDATDGKLKPIETKQAETELRLKDLEQKTSRGGGGGAPAIDTKSWGAQVAASADIADKLKAIDGQARRGSIHIEIKNINPIMGAGSGSSGASLVAPDRQAGIDMLPQRPIRIRDLLRPGTTTSNPVQVMQQVSRVNNAATVAEGTLKPQSDLGWNLENFPVQTIAHWIQASKQVLSDVGSLAGTIDTELLYGLADVEDRQLLNGDGTGTNLLGINPQASPFVWPAGFPPVADYTYVDVLRVALVQARLALFPATGIVLHPADWAAIQLGKDAQGRYLYGDPNDSASQPVLWGCPVVETEAQPQGNFLVGAFGIGAQIFDREEASVLVSSEDRDNFVKNLVTILGEERLALAVRRPAAFVKGAFATAIPPGDVSAPAI